MNGNFHNYLKTKTDLKDEQIGLFIKGLKIKQFNKGEFLLNKGDVCHHSFFVEKGLLRSYTIDELGKEHIIQFAPENWIMTDRSSAYFNEASDLYIDAIEETTVVFIDKEFVNRLAELSVVFRQNNEQALHNHIRNLQKRINLLLGATAEKRYLEFIALYPDLMLRVPQWMIASFLGITPEGLSRVRKELAKRHFKPQK